MDCTGCDAALPVRARYCPCCGAQVRLLKDLTLDEPTMRTGEKGDVQNAITSRVPEDHEGLKARLIDCYVNFSMSKELSGWLQQLGLPSTGTMQEKLARLRLQASSLVLPAESLPRQTIWYLNRYDKHVLTEICQELGIDDSGTKESLVTRIYHAVGLREGWLQPLSEEARQIITETFLPILRAVDHKNYDDFERWGELGDILGREHPDRPGTHSQGSAFMAVLIPGLLQEGHAVLLQHELEERAGTGS